MNPEEVSSQKDELSPVSSVEPDSTAQLDAYLQWFDANVGPVYQEKNDAALRYQKLFKYFLVFTYAAAAVAVGIVVFQTLFFPHLHHLIWLEVALIMAMIAAHVIERKKNFEHEEWYSLVSFKEIEVG